MKETGLVVGDLAAILPKGSSPEGIWAHRAYFGNDPSGQEGCS